MTVHNSIVVITGASKGLGKELALRLAKDGAKLVLGARSLELLKEVGDPLGALCIQMDIKEEDQVNALAQAAVDKFGRIDLWINNAAIWLPRVPVMEVSMARFHKIMEVNLFGTVYGTRAALKQMQGQGSGMIVNIISTSGLKGNANSSAYAASKFAVTGFTQSVRAECAGSEIKVISVFPGGMQTHLFDEAKPENYVDYMDTAEVAAQIVVNLKAENPDVEQVLRRPTA